MIHTSSHSCSFYSDMTFSLHWIFTQVHILLTIANASKPDYFLIHYLPQFSCTCNSSRSGSSIHAIFLPSTLIHYTPILTSQEHLAWSSCTKCCIPAIPRVSSFSLFCSLHLQSIVLVHSNKIKWNKIKLMSFSSLSVSPHNMPQHLSCNLAVLHFSLIMSL